MAKKTAKAKKAASKPKRPGGEPSDQIAMLHQIANTLQEINDGIAALQDLPETLNEISSLVEELRDALPDLTRESEKPS